MAYMLIGIQIATIKNPICPTALVLDDIVGKQLPLENKDCNYDDINGTMILT